jgi:hypothetical protein
LKGKLFLSTFGHHGVHPAEFHRKISSKFKDNDKIVFVMINLDDDIATGKQF